MLPLIESGIGERRFAGPMLLTDLVPLFFFLFLRTLYEDRPASPATATASAAFEITVPRAPAARLVPWEGGGFAGNYPSCDRFAVRNGRGSARTACGFG